MQPASLHHKGAVKPAGATHKRNRLSNGRCHLFRLTKASPVMTTQHTSEFLQVKDEEFLQVVHPQQKLHTLASKEYAFAHEGPVYLADTNEVFFVSDR